ncbi:MAG: putative maltokinase, partial [Candidatus Binatia bacterium]
VFRRVDEGINPDLEIGLFLTERISFANVPRVLGALEYRKKNKEPMTLGILHAFVPNQGDAWRYTLDSLGRYFEDVLAKPAESKNLVLPSESYWDLLDPDPPFLVGETVGPYLASAQLLGQRTGELHRALASDTTDAAFAPEPFTGLDRRSLYQSLRTSAEQSFQMLDKTLRRGLPEETEPSAQKVLERSREIFKKFHALVERDLSGLRIRCHGDYHLGQVLYTGKDFVIIDFEGEPTRSLSERRIKKSPLRDVAGMLRSFHYASVAKLKSGQFRPEDIPSLQPWSRFWHFWVSVTFLKAYLSAVGDSSILPKSRADIQLLLDLHLLEKNLYELRYEINHRPDWLNIPLQGILQLLETRRNP